MIVDRMIAPDYIELTRGRLQTYRVSLPLQLRDIRLTANEKLAVSLCIAVVAVVCAIWPIFMPPVVMFVVTVALSPTDVIIVLIAVLRWKEESGRVVASLDRNGYMGEDAAGMPIAIKWAAVRAATYSKCKPNELDLEVDMGGKEHVLLPIAGLSSGRHELLRVLNRLLVDAGGPDIVEMR